MKKVKLILALVLLLALSVPAAYMLITEKMLLRFPALIQENPRITFVIGKAYFRKNEQDGWTHAIVGTKLYNSYEIKTEKNSIMDIRFHDTMAIRLQENSTLKIDDLNAKKIFLNVRQGSMFGTFEKIFKNHSLKINTPTTVASVRGTELGFEVIKLPNDKKAEDKKQDQKDDVKKDEKTEDSVNTDTNEKALNEGKKEEVPATRIFALSGITELYNPEVEDQKVLLSYQNKLIIKENSKPGNPEKMSEEEIARIRAILNSIHKEEVLLISEKITFAYGSAKIQESSFEELDKIVAILKKRNINIRIEGHTDNQGDAASNQKLSVLRAKSIQEYFVKKGIKNERLSIAGFGLSKPIASNATAKGRSMNRRVEFIIVKKKSFFDFLNL